MHSGVGLGLSMFASLAKAMNGDITIESEIEKGSSFTVEIPNSFAKINEKPLLKTEHVDAKEQPCIGKKIHIAEDDENSFAVLRELLEEDNIISHEQTMVMRLLFKPKTINSTLF